ncbi:hypothetical protein JQ99_001988 [Salmonella enterica subsp. enterica]|nr:hypothetical protein [Salmonella enterica subsp. enterica]
MREATSMFMWWSILTACGLTRALILHFHTEVWQRIGELSWQRQQAR